MLSSGFGCRLSPWVLRTRGGASGWLLGVALVGVGCPGPDTLMWNATASSEAGTTTLGGGETTSTSSPATEDGGTTSGDDSDDDGQSFVSDPTGSTFDCDVVSQDCPEGEKCTLWAHDGGPFWNAARCVPVVPEPVGPGEPCTVEDYATSGLDDCEHGSICWHVDREQLTGECVPFCIDADGGQLVCADEERECRITSSGPPLCFETCHPLAKPCGRGAVCVATASSFQCLPDASPPDGGDYGDPCEYINVCSPGLFCGAAAIVPGCQGSSGCCSEFCDLSDDDFECAGADGGQVCVPWFEEGQAPPGYETLGACALPS